MSGTMQETPTLCMMWRFCGQRRQGKHRRQNCRQQKVGTLPLPDLGNKLDDDAFRFKRVTGEIEKSLSWSLLALTFWTVFRSECYPYLTRVAWAIGVTSFLNVVFWCRVRVSEPCTDHHPSIREFVRYFVAVIFSSDPCMDFHRSCDEFLKFRSTKKNCRRPEIRQHGRTRWPRTVARSKCS